MRLGFANYNLKKKGGFNKNCGGGAFKEFIERGSTAWWVIIWSLLDLQDTRVGKEDSMESWHQLSLGFQHMMAARWMLSGPWFSDTGLGWPLLPSVFCGRSRWQYVICHHAAKLGWFPHIHPHTPQECLPLGITDTQPCVLQNHRVPGSRWATGWTSPSELAQRWFSLNIWTSTYLHSELSFPLSLNWTSN